MWLLDGLAYIESPRWHDGPHGSTVTGNENLALANLPLVEEQHDQKLESACWRAWGVTRAEALERGLLIPAPRRRGRPT